MKFLSVLLTALVLIGCQAQAPRVRPEIWARPVISGELKNWYQVDEKVYRSAQPGAADMKMAEAFGIREVLNLRNMCSDEDEAAGTTLILHRIETAAGDLTEDQITAALKIIRDARGPILVHCWYGSDRTGAVIAAYRVVMQGWSKDDAVEEMINGDYGFHARYVNLVDLVQKLNVKQIKRELQAR